MQVYLAKGDETDSTRSMYRVVYSDGHSSDPMLFSALDAVSQLLLKESEREASPSPPLVSKKRRRGASRLDTRRRKRQECKRKQQTRQTSVNAPVASRLGRSDSAETLQRSVDRDWEQHIQDHLQETLNFPAIPEQSRVYASIRKWRELISSPHINLACCAVCAEEMSQSSVLTFGVGGNSENENALGNAVLASMQFHLARDPRLPNYLEELPQGEFVLLWLHH